MDDGPADDGPVCRLCGERIVPPERAALRDYCKAKPCVEAGMRPLKVVAVPVHKSIPMFVPATAWTPGQHLDARRNR